MWRQPGEEYKDKCVLPTVKHGGWSVMVGLHECCRHWELQFIEGTMNANMRWHTEAEHDPLPSRRAQGSIPTWNDHCLAKEAEGKGDGLAKHV